MYLSVVLIGLHITLLLLHTFVSVVSVARVLLRVPIVQNKKQKNKIKMNKRSTARSPYLHTYYNTDAVGSPPQQDPEKRRYRTSCRCRRRLLVRMPRTTDRWEHTYLDTQTYTHGCGSPTLISISWKLDRTYSNKKHTGKTKHEQMEKAFLPIYFAFLVEICAKPHSQRIILVSEWSL